MSRICQFSRDARQMRYGKKFATKLEMDTHSHATHVPGVRAHSRAHLLGSKLSSKSQSIDPFLPSALYHRVRCGGVWQDCYQLNPSLTLSFTFDTQETNEIIFLRAFDYNSRLCERVCASVWNRTTYIVPSDSAFWSKKKRKKKKAVPRSQSKFHSSLI